MRLLVSWTDPFYVVRFFSPKFPQKTPFILETGTWLSPVLFALTYEVKPTVYEVFGGPMKCIPAVCRYDWFL